MAEERTAWRNATSSGLHTQVCDSGWVGGWLGVDAGMVQVENESGKVREWDLHCFFFFFPGSGFKMVIGYLFIEDEQACQKWSDNVGGQIVGRSRKMQIKDRQVRRQKGRRGGRGACRREW